MSSAPAQPPSSQPASGPPAAAASRPRVLYLASGAIAVPALATLAAARAECNLVGVITQPPRPCGRARQLTPTPVGQWCAAHGLEAWHPESVNSPDVLARVADWRLDLIVVFAFGQLLSGALLRLPRFGCMNVHASLLPRHRGASPVVAAILAGDRQTGITFMRMVKKLDAGPIYTQHPMDLDGRETAADLELRLADQAARELLPTVAGVLAGRLAPTPQPAAGVTYAPRLAKADGRLDWSLPAAELARRVRAFHPWPGATTWLATGRKRRQLTITAAHFVAQEHDLASGTVARADANGLLIACGRQLLAVDRLVPEGSREMTASAFLRGCPLPEGSRLGHEATVCQL